MDAIDITDGTPRSLAYLRWSKPEHVQQRVDKAAAKVREVVSAVPVTAEQRVALAVAAFADQPEVAAKLAELLRAAGSPQTAFVPVDVPRPRKATVKATRVKASS